HAVPLDMRKLERSALDRLAWTDYHLTKVYEYSQLKNYEAKTMPTVDLMKKMFDLKKNKQALGRDINSIVNELGIAFEYKFNELRGALISDLSEGYQQDKKYRKISLSTKSHPQILQTLNSEGIVTINLQRDFGIEIIEADQHDARIMDIQVPEFDLVRKGIEGQKLEVAVELGERGIIRKNADFFEFFTEPNDSPRRWRTTLDESGKPINASGESEGYKELINFIRGEGNSKSSIFTSPPAWSDVQISVIDKSSEEDYPAIEKIYLEVKLSYQENSNASENVIDLRLQNPPAGMFYTVNRIGGNNQSQVDTLAGNFYTTAKRNELLSFSLPEGIKGFKNWNIKPRILRKGKDLTARTIRISPERNVRVWAVFEEAKPASPPSPAPTPKEKPALEPGMIVMYDQIDSQSPKVTGKTCASLLSKQFKENPQEVKGYGDKYWVKISYSGKPVYLKIEDLKVHKVDIYGQNPFEGSPAPIAQTCQFLLEPLLEYAEEFETAANEYWMTFDYRGQKVYIKSDDLSSEDNIFDPSSQEE
ncbi:MAG: hypothetical protein AAGJ18_28840, partial [Bacteroidota bacterium]